jgi:site-specific DNA recombinase
MKAAVYCRYSSDKQREASIEDQARNCLRVAEREGWAITKVYEDQATTGSHADRAGYQAMLADAKARQFDVLLVDDMSRLSRDQVEAESTFRRLEYWGIRVIGVADGYDSQAASRKVHRTVKNLMNEVYLDDLAERTHRGLEGQARAGNNAGGRAYGYRPVPVEDPSRPDAYGRPTVTAVRREIDPEQAAIVRQIFQWFAEGFSARWMADELNRLKVPSPGAGRNRKLRRRDGMWLASAIAGAPRKGTGILNNELYRGSYVWNRTKWVRDPETRRRVCRLRPEADWVVQRMPELQIVSDELWRLAKSRQAETHRKSAAIRTALHNNARIGRSPKYLLSGLLKCGICGSNFVMAGATHYACASRTNGGAHACHNGLRVSRTIAESKLLAGIKAELSAPEYLEEFKRAVRQALADSRDARSAQRDARTRRLAELSGEIENMVAAVVAGLLSPTLKSKLEAAEAERSALRSDSGTSNLPTVADLLPLLGSTYSTLVENLERVPPRYVDRARTTLKGLIGEVRLIPEGEYLTAEFELEGARLLAAADAKISVVAGACFGLVQYSRSSALNGSGRPSCRQAAAATATNSRLTT